MEKRFLSTLKITFPHINFLITLLATKFYRLTTETTSTTTTNSISYINKEIRVEKKFCFFLTDLPFGNSYEILM